MATIIILGAGVMGSALAVPAADNGHRVRLAATPLDGDILAALRVDRAAHPRLGAAIPDAVEPVDAPDLAPADAAAADLVVIGVSSPGIPWAVDTVARLRPSCPVALVTKGLVSRGSDRPETYATALPPLLDERGLAPTLIGIGGPCIARELAERRPSAVVYAAETLADAEWMRDLFATSYYRIATSTDFVGVEACAAMKNFFAIGVSAMLGRHTRGGEPVKNPVAAAFQQAADEMEALAVWLGGRPGVGYSLPGVGDLHVTVGGGRNSRLGRLLGEGLTLGAAMDGPLMGETVEGVDTGRVLRPAILDAFASGALNPARFPLARAIVDAVETRGHFQYEI
jgi:glycerol-3-phosphate dehydrogenase (NAD(P)+)